MSEDVKVEQSSGDVFKDLGFSDAEAERAMLKADLAFVYTASDIKRGKWQ